MQITHICWSYVRSYTTLIRTPQELQKCPDGAVVPSHSLKTGILYIVLYDKLLWFTELHINYPKIQAYLLLAMQMVYPFSSVCFFHDWVSTPGHALLKQPTLRAPCKCISLWMNRSEVLCKLL